MGNIKHTLFTETSSEKKIVFSQVNRLDWSIMAGKCVDNAKYCGSFVKCIHMCYIKIGRVFVWLIIEPWSLSLFVVVVVVVVNSLSICERNQMITMWVAWSRVNWCVWWTGTRRLQSVVKNVNSYHLDEKAIESTVPLFIFIAKWMQVFCSVFCYVNAACTVRTFVFSSTVCLTSIKYIAIMFIFSKISLANEGKEG